MYKCEMEKLSKSWCGPTILLVNNNCNLQWFKKPPINPIISNIWNLGMTPWLNPVIIGNNIFWTPGLPEGVLSNCPCPCVCPSVFKATGGSGVKKTCWSYLKGSIVVVSTLFTKCQNFTPFRSYQRFNVLALWLFYSNLRGHFWHFLHFFWL